MEKYVVLDFRVAQPTKVRPGNISIPLILDLTDVSFRASETSLPL